MTSQLRAAVYARKSNDDGGRSAEIKSTAVQIADCTAYAKKHGYTVDAKHIFKDEGVSGALFGKERPGLHALLTALQSSRRPFDAVLVTEQSRIGRDAILTVKTIMEIQNAGARIFAVRDDREIDLEASEGMGEVQEFIAAWSGAQERKRAGQRIRPSLRERAKAGHVCYGGGGTFGYKSVEVKVAGGTKRDHVEFVIVPEQAKTIRRIFEMVAQGFGFKRIVSALNREGVPGPRGAKFSPTGLRKILFRDTYRGRLVYGKTKLDGRARRGKKAKQVATPQSAWTVTEVPSLRIVPEPLWRAAHARLAKTRETYEAQRLRKSDGKLAGRPEAGLIAQHLLSGFLRCGVCDGNLFVLNQKASAKSEPKRFYVCTNHHKRGDTACANAARLKYADITEKVIDCFGPDFLKPEVLDEFIAQERAEREPEALAAERAVLETDIARLSGEIAKLVKLAAIADDVEALGADLNAKNAALKNAKARLEVVAAREAEEGPFDSIVEVFHNGRLIDTGTNFEVRDLRGTLRANIPLARTFLRHFLDGGHIKVTPKYADGATLRFEAFDFEATGRLDVYLGQLAGRITRLDAPTSEVVPSPDSPCPRSDGRRPSSA